MLILAVLGCLTLIVTFINLLLIAVAIEQITNIRASVEVLEVTNGKNVCKYLYKHGFTSIDVNKFDGKEFLREMEEKKNV